MADRPTSPPTAENKQSRAAESNQPPAAESQPPPAAEIEQRGDPAAVVDLTALIVAHHAAVYRYACRLCGCTTEAEDLTQQTFLIAQQRLHQIREPERARGWLLAVLRSCFLKSLRKPRPTPAQDVELRVEQIADHESDVEEFDREEVAAALTELSDEFRIVVLMFYFEELSYHQIAEQLDIPIGTVMSRLSRAKRHLRQRLAPAVPTGSKVVPPPRTQLKGGAGSTTGLRASHQ